MGKEGLMQITRMLGDALGRAISFLPNILAGLLILAVGLIVAKVLEAGTRRLLSAIGLHRRPRARELLGQGAALERLPRTGGRVVFWVLAFVTAGLAVDALHLAWLSAGVGRVIAYLPHVLAAGAIVAVAYVAGNFVYRKLASREGASAFGARMVRGGIFALAAFMALQELRIATSIVTIAFTVALAAMGVAAAVAFGLGNRELAGRVTRDWYEQRRPARYRRYEAGYEAHEHEDEAHEDVAHDPFAEQPKH
jgi:hypothetical protein